MRSGLPLALATRLISRIRAVLMRRSRSAARFFEAPSAGAGAAAWGGRGAARPGVRGVERPAEIPLSGCSGGCGFYRLEGPSATYVIPLAVRLFGELEVSALEGR